MAFIAKIPAELGKLTKIERFTLCATVVGLVADLIALASYVGIKDTLPESSVSSRNADGFFVWMLIALLYSLGFINYYIWDRLPRSFHERTYRIWSQSPVYSKKPLGAFLVVGHALLAAFTSFPVTFLYIRALQGSAQLPIDIGTSPWEALAFTALSSPVFICIIMFVSVAFSIVSRAFVG